jgi:hypothetical protein
MNPGSIRELKRRFQQSFGSLDGAVLRQRSKAIVGTDNLPNTPQGQLAVTALHKLQLGDNDGPSPAELAALEYMIRLMRPAPLVRKGTVEPMPNTAFSDVFSAWDGFRAKMPTWVYSVGKISRRTTGGSVAEGTGFVVAPGLMVTNKHVLDAISNGVRELQAGQASVLFHSEDGYLEAETPITIRGVKAVHETLDLSLLQLEDNSALVPITISKRRPDNTSQVAAIGFPYPDFDRDPLFITNIFGNSFGLKRAAPGFVTGVQQAASAVFHDCSTLGGNSGSPLVSLEDGSVMGVHRGGGFLWRNEAVAASVLAAWLQEVA